MSYYLVDPNNSTAVVPQLNNVPELPHLVALIAMFQRFGFALNFAENLYRGTKGVLDKATKAVGQEVTDVKNPVVTGISYVGSSQCSNVKKIFGVDYEQVKGSQAPDAGNLTLNFISVFGRRSFFLYSVASELPAARVLGNNDQLKVFLHGFTDSPEKTNFKLVNEAIRKSGHTCILALDASSLIKYLYLRSTTYVRFIGEKLGRALAELVRIGVQPKNIHLIGHSLGAHIAGFTGKTFASLTGQKVGRITGLDPAGPCFSHVDEDFRLKDTDAVFVDAIHTDGGVYGLTDTVGQADYFPNGGTQQPNCFLESCSHGRAVTLFAESIKTPEGFPAIQCNDYEEFTQGKCRGPISMMGIAAAPGTRGRYYLQTNITEPYAQGMQGLQYVNRDGLVKSARNIVGKILLG